VEEFTCPERDSKARIRALVKHVKRTGTEACVQMQGGFYVDVHPKELKNAPKFADELVWTYENATAQLDLWGGETRFGNLVPKLRVHAKELPKQLEKLKPYEITGTLTNLYHLAFVAQFPFIWTRGQANKVVAILEGRTNSRQGKIALTSNQRSRAAFQKAEDLIQEAIGALSKPPYSLSISWKRAAREWINHY